MKRPYVVRFICLTVYYICDIIVDETNLVNNRKWSPTPDSGLGIDVQVVCLKHRKQKKMNLTTTLVSLLKDISLEGQTTKEAIEKLLKEELPMTSKEQILLLLQHEACIMVIHQAVADLVVTDKPQADTIELVKKLDDLDTRFAVEMIIMAMCGKAPWKPDTDGRLAPFIHRIKKAVEKFKKNTLTTFEEKDILQIMRKVIRDLLLEFRQCAIEALQTKP